MKLNHSTVLITGTTNFVILILVLTYYIPYNNDTVILDVLQIIAPT